MLKLLKDISLGLESQGYTVRGGSDHWIMMRDIGGTTVKLFLNDYTNPTHVIVKYST